MPSELRYVTAKDVRIMDRPGSVGIRIEIEGDRTILNAEIRRTFPLATPNDLLSIRDGSGGEVAILETLEGLDAASRTLAERELDRRYFTPVITRIHSLKQEAGMWRFLVDSQRGEADFYVRNWRDSAHELTHGRWHITTVDGARFEIHNLESLDPKSQKLMDQLL